MRRLFGGRKLVAVAMAFATVLGVCSVAGGPSAAAGTVQGITGNTIRIGGVYDSSTFAGTPTGFMARVDRANRTHELGKYKIDVVGIEDDQTSSTTDLTDVQNLVERDNLFALGPVVTTGFAAASASVAVTHQVEYFGAGFVSAFCAPNTWGVSMTGCIYGGKYTSGENVLGLAKALGKPASQLTFAVAGLDIPEGVQSDSALVDAIKHYGGKVVFNQADVPLSGGNYAAIVNQIEATKPDVVWANLGAQAIGFEAAAKASGYTGAITDAVLYAPGILKIASVASAINGTYKTTSTPLFDGPSPWAKQLLKDYVSSGSSASAITFGGLYGYLTADLMIAVLKNAIAKNQLSGSGIHSLMTKGFTYTSPNAGSYTYKYPFMFNAPYNCGAVVKVVGPAYQVAAPFTCYTTYLHAGSTKVAIK
jgi:ABC-type branched-subunit amino acid transport system substrate-binding protein